MKVHISPAPSKLPANNGVGRVIQAQYKYLPEYGIELVDDPRDADVIAAHITADHLPRVDVLHCHGLYWTADGGEWEPDHHITNMQVAAATRRARAVTVPSEWVAMPFKRDMGIKPVVIGHGIDVDAWERDGNLGCILWNKNRTADACDPTPAIELAKRGLPVMSTFGDPRVEAMGVIGVLPHDEMKRYIQMADVYLATAQETFGIGTLEAMACGVPVLGYNWGGTADIVSHKHDGYLAKPNDIDDLYEGYRWIKENYAYVSEHAWITAAQYRWQTVIGQYAELYHSLLKPEPCGVCVVITNYNYGRYVGDAIASVLNQTHPAAEIIVVDDGSTDGSQEIIKRVLPDHPTMHAIFQENQGVAAARNWAISKTSQPFIICLDADDQLDPHYIATLLPDMLQNRALGIAYSGLNIFDDEGNTRATDWPPDFNWDTQTAVNNPPSNCIPSAAMFRREMWRRSGGIIQNPPAEDVEFWTRGLACGFEAKRVTTAPLFHYRVHQGQAHRTKRYSRIDGYLPWMRDGHHPFAAPVQNPVPVRSYAAPIISVIVPCGAGHQKYLRTALMSLKGQSFREWEVIVVNDTGQPLETLPFAHVIDTGGRKGAGAARNLGLEAAKGDLVYFLDADDYLLPDGLLAMLKAWIDQDGRYYIYTDYLHQQADGKRQRQRLHAYKQGEWRGQHAVNVLMSRDDAVAIGGFDPDLSGWEDWDFALKCATHGICGYHLPSPTFVYRSHSGTLRENSLREKDELLPLLKRRYGNYFNGGYEMPRCCGGGNAAVTILKAKGAMPPVLGSTPTVNNGDPTMTRMIYTGQNVGSIAFSRVGGKALTRTYRGGNNANDRYADVADADVALLENTGRWEVVARPSVPASGNIEPPSINKTPEPVADAAVTGTGKDGKVTVKDAEILATDGAVTEAEKLGVDLSAVTGTGKDGKVTVKDVRAVAATA